MTNNEYNNKMTRYQKQIATARINGQAYARQHRISHDEATAEYMAAYIRERQRKYNSTQKAREHDQNRAKAKARRKALHVIFAAAINAKEY